MPKTILVLDDDDDLRTSLCELLDALGDCACVPAWSVAHLLAAPERALGCDLALLDVNLGAGAPSGVDAYRWLRDNGFRGKVVFLTGHGRGHPVVEAARTLEGVRVFEKPVPFEVLERLAVGSS